MQSKHLRPNSSHITCCTWDSSINNGLSTSNQHYILSSSSLLLLLWLDTVCASYECRVCLVNNTSNELQNVQIIVQCEWNKRWEDVTIWIETSWKRIHTKKLSLAICVRSTSVRHSTNCATRISNSGFSINQRILEVATGKLRTNFRLFNFIMQSAFLLGKLYSLRSTLRLVFHDWIFASKLDFTQKCVPTTHAGKKPTNGFALETWISPISQSILHLTDSQIDQCGSATVIDHNSLFVRPRSILRITTQCGRQLNKKEPLALYASNVAPERPICALCMHLTIQD